MKRLYFTGLIIFLFWPGSVHSQIIYSTFLGGSDIDEGLSLALHPQTESVFITGSTESADFPTTTGGYDKHFDGYQDWFVCKLSADGAILIYSTFIGGSRGEQGESIEVDKYGCAYVHGGTVSPDFPTTPGSYCTTLPASSFADASYVILKLSEDGSTLIFSTLIGGTGRDRTGGLALDSDGNTYIAGESSSSNFPTTPGAFDTTYNGNFDVVVSKLSADGSSLIYSTYLGTSENEGARDIAVDSTGHAYVTGLVRSPSFPTTPGAFDTTHNGSVDFFLTKLNPGGSSLVYSTFIGGMYSDYGTNVSVDTHDFAYITGETISPDFPVTAGSYDTIFNVSNLADAVVCKVSVDGTSLFYSTYLGGEAPEHGMVIDTDIRGCAYVTGTTSSHDFPVTTGAHDLTFNGAIDIYVSMINSDGSSLLYSTFLGGSNGDSPRWDALAVDDLNSVYVSGYTYSPDFPVTTGAFDVTHNGIMDAFVTKISIPLPLVPCISFSCIILIFLFISFNTWFCARTVGNPPKKSSELEF